MNPALTVTAPVTGSNWSRGTTQTVAGYLITEVITHQPDHVRQFLEDTCVVEELDAAQGWRRVLTDDEVRAHMEMAGRVAAQHLERYLSALGTLASAAPLLGLLGTVVGMIEIFGSQAPGGTTGGNPAQLALLAGQVDFNIDNLATAAPNIRAGKLKALAVTTAKRSGVLPDVPAMAELLPGLEIDTWWGLVAPAATPVDVVQRLHQAFAAALNDPQTRERFAQLMAEPVVSTPAAFGEFMASERAKYEKVVKASGARVD